MNFHPSLIAQRVFLAALLCLATLLTAQDKGAPVAGNSGAAAAGESTRPMVEAAQKDEDYRIAADDVLDVYVVDVAELTRACRVNPSGTISLPLIGKPLPAAGLTLLQLADSIAKALRESGTVMSAQVTVSVQQSRLHSVSVAGAVRHPQIYPVFGRTTLLDVISQAEGLADDAGNVAIVRRGDIAVRALNLDPGDDAALTTRVDLKQVMEVRDVSTNLMIFPGDHVTIPRAGIVYVVGAVTKPGGYTIRANSEGMTVMQAVALAEDVKSTARRDHAMIVRFDSSSMDKRTQIPVNLKTILAGKSPDLVLRANDILFVPDNNSKKAFQRGVEAAVQLATGMAIYSRY